MSRSHSLGIPGTPITYTSYVPSRRRQIRSLCFPVELTQVFDSVLAGPTRHTNGDLTAVHPVSVLLEFTQFSLLDLDRRNWNDSFIVLAFDREQFLHHRRNQGPFNDHRDVFALRFARRTLSLQLGGVLALLACWCAGASSPFARASS